MSLRLTLRSGSLAQWATAEAAGNGRLRKGEIGVGWIEVAGTITEVVMRIGPSATPTAFSACPVISRSPLTATGANIRIPVLDTTGKTNSLLALSGGQFVAVEDDPGEYPTSATSGGTETAPAITEIRLVRGSPSLEVGEVLNLAHDASVADMTLLVTVSGDPTPIVGAVMESGTSTTTLVGTASGATWSFPVSLSSSASGLHIIRIAASSTRPPAAEARRNLDVQRAAAPSPVSIRISQLVVRNDSTSALVSAIANNSGVTLRAEATTTTTATETTYQWRRGQANIAGATNQTYALTSADNDSAISCVVTVSRTVGSDSATATSTATVAVGTAEPGWTPLSPSSDSRLVYVGVGGSDSTAALNQYGRRYYLPSDPIIGGDPTAPLQPTQIMAYATIDAAVRVIRGNKWLSESSSADNYGEGWASPPTRSGWPDWLLLQRGGTYSPSVATNQGASTLMQTIGRFGQWGYLFGSYAAGHGGGHWSGRSSSEPAVITAWGSASLARPVITGTQTLLGAMNHVRLVSLGTFVQFGGGTDPRAWDSGRQGARDVLVEDCSGVGGAINETWWDGLTIRRCAVADGFNPSGHNSALFLAEPGTSAIETTRVVLEECVFDRNGYKEDPNLPQTWTGALVSALTAGGMPVGAGVQPTRTYFDRNLYLSSYGSMTIRGCIISRGGGGGSVQMREGGVAERNLFLWNQHGLSIGHPQAITSRCKASLIRQNLFLHDDHFLPPGGFGIAIETSGASDDVAVVDDNVIAHFHRMSNGGESINALGKKPYSGDPQHASSPLMRAVIKDNAILHEHGAGGIVVERSASAAYGYVVLDADVTGNEVSAYKLLAGQGDGSKPSAYSWSGNQYHSTGTPTTLFARQWTGEDYRFGTVSTDLAGWKAAGFDADVTAVETNFATFKTAAGWTAPERDIVSYMQSVDPTYVVNEDVYVDDDCTGPKQATRQKVWQVLMQNVPYGLFNEAQAKQSARRYHAFITFIQRARANRKGTWDPRWTAEAVNNHIRQGFGKTSVNGPYTGALELIGTY